MTGASVTELPVPAPARPPCPRTCQTNAALFGPDDVVFTAGQQGVVRVWGRAGELLRELEPAPGSLRRAALSPDGTRIAAAAGSSAPVWEVGTGEVLHELPVPATHLAFGPDGTALAVAGEDGLTTLWDTATGDPTGELRHRSTPRDIAWSPGGQFLLVATGAGAELWDVAAGQPLQRFDAHGGAQSATFTTDGHAVVGGNDGVVEIHECVACGSPEELLALHR